MDGFFPQKGGSHVVDDCCCTDNFVAARPGEQLYVGRVHTHPVGHCHCRCADQGHSRAKSVIATLTLAGEGEAFGEESGKHLQKDFAESFDTLQ
jgi:hypothetical protein